jgi:flavin reductase (DIM6/NTAB) family NADH-FMN oxidoreductase RutF
MDTLLQKLTYGHYIITARKAGEELKTRKKDYLAAGSVNWLTQLSFEPELIGVAIGMQSDLNETIDYSQQFTIHLLSEEQTPWIEKFAGASTIEDGKINGVPFVKKDHALILEGTLGYLNCRVAHSQNFGDHTFYAGEVIGSELTDAQAPPNCTKHSKKRYTEQVAAV